MNYKCLPFRDVRMHGHLLPAAIMLVATGFAAVQGNTMVTVQCGIVLWGQILFSVLSVTDRGSVMYHNVAYTLASIYPPVSLLGLTFALTRTGAILLYVAFGTMTSHYFCRDLGKDDDDSDAPVIEDGNPTVVDAL